MKYTYSLWLVLAMLGIHYKSDAQASLGLYTTAVSNSTPPLSSQILISTELRNLSATDTFTGVVSFLLANQDSVMYDPNVVGLPNFNNTTVTLGPGDHKAALFTVDLLPSHFKVGPDIIIVWPVAAVRIVDSARAPIVITAPLGMQDLSSDPISAYVSEDHLIVKNTDTKIRLQRVQIYDLAGKRVSDQPVDATDVRIPLRDLSHGVYIAEMICDNGVSKRVRFGR